MLKFALKNLREDFKRFLLSIGGVAAAVLLILALQGVFAGSGKQIAIFIDKSQADVIVAQAGVKNMHMANSLIPLNLLERIRQVPGVAKADPITYFTDKVKLGTNDSLGIIVGIDSTATMGIPWRMAAGSPLPGPGEVVVPQSLAKANKLGIGDQIKILEKSFKISGLSLETEGIATNFVFVSLDDAHYLHSLQGMANYVLVRATDPETSISLTKSIETQIPELSAFTRSTFAESERQIAIQMGLDIIQAMSVAALVIGLMVIMLTLYNVTVEKSREYGILKAIGASNAQLFGVVLIQAFFSTITGFLVGTAAAFGISRLVGVLIPKVGILLDVASIEQTFLLVLGMALVASLLPAWRIARVDPLIVFNRS